MDRNHIKISRGTALRSPLTFPHDSQARALVHSRWNLDLKYLFFSHLSLSPALGTGFFDQLPSTLAGGAGSANGEKALLVSNAPLPLAGGTGAQTLLRICSCTLTGFASLLAGNLDLRFHSSHSFHKTDLKIVSKIRSPPRLVRLSSGAPKDIPETEKITQDVTEIGEYVGIESLKSSSRGTDASMPKAIVSSSLIGVTQDAVRFGSLFKLFLRLLVPGILIGMVLDGQLPISALDFLLTGVFSDTEYFVVISFLQSTLLRYDLAGIMGKPG